MWPAASETLRTPRTQESHHMLRRLPLYLIIDASASLRSRQAEVNIAARNIISAVRSDLWAVEAVWIERLILADRTSVSDSLAPAYSFSVADAAPRGGTADLGECLDVLSREIAAGAATSPESGDLPEERSGDLRPLVILFTAGLPRNTGGAGSLPRLKNADIITLLFSGGAASSPAGEFSDLVFEVGPHDACPKILAGKIIAYIRSAARTSGKRGFVSMMAAPAGNPSPENPASRSHPDAPAPDRDAGTGWDAAPRAVFGQGEYQFESGSDFNAFIDELLREKRFRDLREVMARFGPALRELDRDLWRENSYDRLSAAISQASFIDRFLSSFSRTPAVLGSVSAGGRKYFDPRPGRSVFFGSCRQHDPDVKTPIEWLVLEVSGEGVLLLSRYVLDSLPFHFWKTGASWKKSELRNWLNGSFLEEAFTREERRAIAVSRIATDDPLRKKSEVSRDRVFCLSIAEAGRYFQNMGDLMCRPTAYARNHEAPVNLRNGFSPWWLRSQGRDPCYVMRVNTDSRQPMHWYSARHPCGVRPVLRALLN